jgi:hypothetical protein
MTMQGDSIRVMLLVTDVLEKMGIPYAVGGSLSSSVHGVMRSTLDILGVVKTKSDQLDLAYLRRWAKELAVEDLLERALQEATA